jgi:hypothetical protein
LVVLALGWLLPLNSAICTFNKQRSTNSSAVSEPAFQFTVKFWNGAGTMQWVASGMAVLHPPVAFDVLLPFLQFQNAVIKWQAS